MLLKANRSFKKYHELMTNTVDYQQYMKLVA